MGVASVIHKPGLNIKQLRLLGLLELRSQENTLLRQKPRRRMFILRIVIYKRM